MADRRVSNTKAPAQIEGLGEVPRGDLHLVTPGLELGDHRP
jgi:hypothetical protein